MSSKIVNITAILVLVVLCFCILTNSMTKTIGRDENMYCTAGVLLAQGKMIYRDFSYPSQLPYHPLLLAVPFKLFNTTHYLLTGRIVSSLCDILVVVCIIGIYRKIFGCVKVSGTFLGLAGAVLYVFNPVVDYANGYAWNHDVVILCVISALWLFISYDLQQKTKWWRIAAIGALLTFASCMRITTVLVQMLFFAALLIQPAESAKKRIETTLPFLAATFIFLIWPVWIVFQAPRAFYLNLYRIPVLYGEWLHEIGMVHNKIDLILSCITKPGYLALLIIAVYLYVVFIWKQHSLPKYGQLSLLLAALLAPALFIIALIPPTMWHQYMAMPVPFLIISLAYPLFYLRGSGFRISCAILGICVVVAVVSHPVILYRTPMMLVPEYWVPIQIHNISEDIAQKTPEPKLILTLAPLFALEGGCNIYDEFSAGAIVYRIADRLSTLNREITHAVGPKTLNKLIEKSPPSAVLLGVEESIYEETLVEIAIQPNREKWERKDYRLSPPISLINTTYQQNQQLLSLYH